jgi:hypothetical protein
MHGKRPNQCRMITRSPKVHKTGLGGKGGKDKHAVVMPMVGACIVTGQKKTDIRGSTDMLEYGCSSRRTKKQIIYRGGTAAMGTLKPIMDIARWT